MSGTIRTIIILLIIWWVLRLLLRVGRKKSGIAGPRWTSDTGRPKGEVRIERIKDEKKEKPPGTGDNISDADFEELK